MSKALLIKSYISKNTGVQGRWNELDDAPSYIQGIETGDILGSMTADKLAALISGVPTPWARAKLFKFALQTLSTPNPAIKCSGLLKFYDMLYGEWKGLLAVIALFPDRIKFSAPVQMNIKGNNYDIASAFGRMLFEDYDLWCNQEVLAKNPSAQPYIHLIYYKGHLVGGTSPMTGVFTGVSYANIGTEANDIGWYREGKFEDPTKYLSPDQLQKVYLFVKNLNGNLADFDSKVNSQRGNKLALDLGGFKQMSWKWEDDLKKASKNPLREIGPIAKYGNLSTPFKELFHSEVPVYLKPDFTFTYTDPNGEYKRIDDIQSLLADDENVLGWAEKEDAYPSLKDAPVYFLKVEDVTKKGTCYFTIPFSEQGVEIFKNDLPSILGYKPEQGVSLKAEIVNSGDNAILAVQFVLLIDEERVSLGVREYNIRWQTKPQKVILWPNFISDKWTRYYLYSQQSEATQPRFKPIFQYQREIVKVGKIFFTPDYKSPDGSSLPVGIQELVATPQNAGDSLPKYQIVCYDKPITGLSVVVKQSGNDVNAGFLMIRQDVVRDITDIATSGTATVGFDFGSNNTCVYYKNNNDNSVAPVEFKNFRAMLVGQEVPNPNRVADMDELFFFTNYDTKDGQFKSWLHEHDSRCAPNTLSEEIAGGVPVNRPNVQVNKMEDCIETQVGRLHYNMKWKDSARGLQQKKAFIKSLWLQSCAFLYHQHIMPTRINWSCPGAMQQSDVTELGLIYQSLEAITPIVNHQVQTARNCTTEAEAVCSYAIAQPDFGLTTDNLFLGIDVGGSTSDIMILANDLNTGQISLIKESSVRIAAGAFFRAVTGSRQFREALVVFHEGHRTKVNVMNIKELNDPANKNKAPYYLNCIFDQLKPEEYKVFYESIKDNAIFVFAIPAYVTGILLFYSGMLIGKAIKDGKLSNGLKTVEILPFGKGGRLFHWLYSAAGVNTDDYYKTCLNKGIDCVLPKEVDINVRQQLAANNKTEVARGLCNPQAFVINPDAGQSDICGETGIQFRNAEGVLREIGVCEELDGSYFKDLTKFVFSRGSNFDSYMDAFIRFISRTTKIYEKEEEELKKDMRDVPGRIKNFLQNDEEYAKARRSSEEKFPFHQPIIIAEAASYLNTLIEKIFAH